jgi:hypothetical protein
MRAMLADLPDAVRDVARLRQDGNNKGARVAAREIAESYMHLVGDNGPAPVDPDTLSPREIADLVMKKRLAAP